MSVIHHCKGKDWKKRTFFGSFLRRVAPFFHSGTKWFQALLATTCGLSLCPDRASAASTSGSKLSLRSGYVRTLEDEKKQESPVPLEPPPDVSRQEVLLKDRIFDQRMTEEFHTRYKERFGQTVAEQQVNLLSAPMSTYRTPNGFDQSELRTNQAQRDFGEYMMRRLVEYHLDTWAKNDQKTKQIYAFKERVSKVDVRVAKNVSVNATYSISDQTAQVEMKRADDWTFRTRYIPWASELLMTFMKPLSRKDLVESHILTNDGIFKMIGRRALSDSTGVSLTLSTFFKQEGVTVRENLALAGFQHQF